MKPPILVLGLSGTYCFAAVEEFRIVVVGAAVSELTERPLEKHRPERYSAGSSGQSTSHSLPPTLNCEPIVIFDTDSTPAGFPKPILRVECGQARTTSVDDERTSGHSRRPGARTTLHARPSQHHRPMSCASCIADFACGSRVSAFCSMITNKYMPLHDPVSTGAVIAR